MQDGIQNICRLLRYCFFGFCKQFAKQFAACSFPFGKCLRFRLGPSLSVKASFMGRSTLMSNHGGRKRKAFDAEW